MVSEKLLDKTVCVVGLGYVGLPLAEAFSRHLRTIGYRRNQKAVDELSATPGNRIEATTDQSMIRQRGCKIEDYRTDQGVYTLNGPGHIFCTPLVR